jgi:hypothetical protein
MCKSIFTAVFLSTFCVAAFINVAENKPITYPCNSSETFTFVNSELLPYPIHAYSMGTVEMGPIEAAGGGHYYCHGPVTIDLLGIYEVYEIVTPAFCNNQPGVSNSEEAAIYMGSGWYDGYGNFHYIPVSPLQLSFDILFSVDKVNWQSAGMQVASGFMGEVEPGLNFDGVAMRYISFSNFCYNDTLSGTGTIDINSLIILATPEPSTVLILVFGVLFLQRISRYV